MGLVSDRFSYDHVTTYENSHATKSHPAYYHEILGILGRQPGECLMVGDNWEWEVACAAEAGVAGFWIAATDEIPPPPAAKALGQGSLDEFLELAETGRLDESFAEHTVERPGR